LWGEVVKWQAVVVKKERKKEKEREKRGLLINQQETYK
jgi:hypothetical protein